MKHLIRYNEEVRDALESNQPVVALESTLIAQGHPPHQRRHAAEEIEAAVRDSGAVPATILVHDGAAHIGLDTATMDRLETDQPIQKASVDLLPWALATGITAATTVSSSIALATAAGISVFTTGGLGGVHRGASQTFDVSGDLHALASHSTIAVTAGVKSILDIPATLEVLETLGVTVLTLGAATFPAYYVPNSGAPSQRIDSPGIAARALEARRALDMAGSVLLACPPPPELTIDPALHDRALEAGLAEAAANGVSGPAVTPVLLKHLAEATAGNTSTAGLAITIATARTAAAAALELT